MAKQVSFQTVREGRSEYRNLLNEQDEERQELQQLREGKEVDAYIELQDLRDRIDLAVKALRGVHTEHPDFYDQFNLKELQSVYEDSLRGWIFNHITQQMEILSLTDHREILNQMDATYEERRFYRERLMWEIIKND